MQQLLVVLIGGLIAAAMASGSAVVLPGTPCTDIVSRDTACTATIGTAVTNGLDPLFDLASDPGVVHLPIFVVPGDVVLFESPNGTLTDESTWSDVVEFSDIPGVHGSFATTFADVEPVGILLPPGFTPSTNAIGRQEIPTGAGSDTADFTLYTDGSAQYRIHSDCAGPGCEIPETGEPTPEPSMLGLLGLGFGGLFAAVRLRSR